MKVVNLKEIGIQSRMGNWKINRIKNNIKRWVKVKEKWRKSEKFLNELGYDIKNVVKKRWEIMIIKFLENVRNNKNRIFHNIYKKVKDFDKEIIYWIPFVFTNLKDIREFSKLVLKLLI